MLDRALIVGTQVDPAGTGSVFLSAPGTPSKIVRFYRPRIEKAGFEIERSPGRTSECTIENEVTTYAFACAGIVFGAPTLQGVIEAIGCGRRAQIGVFFSEANDPLFPGVEPCLDPEGTGGVVNRRDAASYLLEEVCEGAFPEFYSYPAPRYSIDQVNSPPSELNEGYEVTRELDDEGCRLLNITGVLEVAPDQVDWRLPANLAERAQAGTVSPDVWLRIGSGRPPEWARLDAGSLVFTPTTPTREALEAFPVVAAGGGRPAPGQSDLVLEVDPVDSEGEGCIPGKPVAGLWNVSVRGAGADAGPSRVLLEVTPPGAPTETRELRFTRGLFPGEDVVIGELGPGTSLRLDPNAQIEEADESNNEQFLAELPPLVCVPL